jgi:hypothetical protein
MNDLVKGICRLGVVPMFSKPEYKSAVVSELLFGEHYMVLSSVKDWFEVELAFDKSMGWIHRSQHFSISDAYFDQINLSDYKVCTDLSGTIFFQKKHVNILLGSILPISSNELFKMEEQIAFNGSSKSLSQRREFEYMKGIIDLYRHTPYRPGGKTPFGIDEGGFIQQVYKICGYRLPRSLSEQSKGASNLSNINELEEGDLVFVGSGANAGALIYLGNNQFSGVVRGSVEKIADLNFGEQELRVKKVLRQNSVGYIS